jgi:hypothetical protein
LAFLLSFTLSGQEYKKVYTEMTDDKLGQILEEAGFSLRENSFGYFVEFESNNSVDFDATVAVNPDDDIVFSVFYPE